MTRMEAFPMAEHQILVVEDERIVAAGIQNELESFGYRVTGVASSALEAVEKAARDRPDLVLMDIHLRGEADGVDAAREIHNRLGMPVVFLSAFADSATVARASETEVYGYLLKPYEEHELHTTIEMALAKHRAERRLAESQRWLGAILGGVDDAVIATDPDYKVQFLNLAAQALTGWQHNDAIGRPFAHVCRLADATGTIPLDDLADQTICESRGVELPQDARLVNRENAERPVEGCLSPIFDPRGEFLGMALTLRDISPQLESDRLRRRHERRRMQARKREAIRRLVGGIAHHWNNLLTVILGNAAMARSKSPGGPELDSALSGVETAGHRAAELVQRLLAFAGRTHSHLRPIRTNEFLEKCLGEIDGILDERVTVAFDFDDDAWPIVADSLQLAQAITGLCLSAQDAMIHGGPITVETRNLQLSRSDKAEHPRGRLGQFVRIRISDTGSGLLHRAAEPLFESPLSAREFGGGFAQGLAFVFAIVEQHHGWVEATDRDGRGSTFDVFMPRAAQESNERPVAGLLSRPAGPVPTILLAEAEPMVRDLGRRILETEGYRVILAADGVQAVEQFRNSPDRVDLAVIDLNLPRLTGNAVMAKLTELDADAAVILTSGYFADDPGIEGTHLAGIVKKPYSRELLLQAVNRAMLRKGQ